MSLHALALASVAVALLLAFAAQGLSGASRRRKRSRRGEDRRPGETIYRATLAWLRGHPYDRMSPPDRRSVRDRLRRADASPGASNILRALVHAQLAEMALVDGDHAAAIAHFRRALELDPRAPVRRTLERLEHPNVLSFCARRSA